MIALYNPYLAALSVIVGVLASHTILDVASRVQKIDGKGLARRFWLLGGAAGVGNGIWVAQLLGMLAFKTPGEMSYDPSLTALSLMVAVTLAYFALRVTTEGELSGKKVARGGVLLGLAMVASQYLGMSALCVQPSIRYGVAGVLGSVGIAIAASWAALWATFLAPEEWAARLKPMRAGAALTLGLGIAGVHHVGMSTAVFPERISRLGGGGFGLPVLVTLIVCSSVCGVGVAVLLSALDSRIDELLLSAQGSMDTGTQRLNAMNGLDPVTGIGSRATFLQGLERKMSVARQEERLLGLVFLDLDGFKAMNDSLGFSGGDVLLRAFSDDLRRRVRVETTLGRLGGDEFALVLDGFDEPEKVGSMARSILERMRTEFEVEGVTMRVTASAGIAVYPRDGASVDALLKSANVAMHAAKQGGASSFRIFDPSMGDAETRTLQIRRGLAEALAKEQFSLVFQPKFDGRGQRITGAEALIRWCHPGLGNISPMDFIPLAEETGQIVAVSEWVIAQVCRQMNAWRKMGLALPKVAINLSPEQLRLDGYAERISGMVRDAGIDPRTIMFEITETAAMREPKLATAAIAEFQQAGFDFAIDDFGTGYSSMAYLQQFRVKELKIDRFFISSLEDGGGEGETIVAAIIALAHALHMTVVAEGVETAAQLTKLNGMECDEVQGYLLGRPLTPGDFEKLLRGETGRNEVTEGAALRPDGQAAKPRLLSAMA